MYECGKVPVSHPAIMAPPLRMTCGSSQQSRAPLVLYVSLALLLRTFVATRSYVLPISRVRNTSAESPTTRPSSHGEAEPDVPRRLLPTVNPSNRGPKRGHSATHPNSSRRIVPQAVNGERYAVSLKILAAVLRTPYDGAVQHLSSTRRSNKHTKRFIFSPNSLPCPLFQLPTWEYQS
jgi:hypothetical protein